MITKREKLQYVYVFLTDLAALAASVILAWLIVGGIMGQLLPLQCSGLGSGAGFAGAGLYRYIFLF